MSSSLLELKKALQPHGIKVSVDVTRENIDPFWSGSLDRKKLGEVADYIIMMGYDEHWGGSPVAGSVASIPWVKEGVEAFNEGRAFLIKLSWRCHSTQENG